jgi:uncharacterized membrane protein (DUF2068 family)
MDWSLLGCGAGGHTTYAPDDPALRERLSTTTRDGEAWRCLRCGTFVIGPPDGTGPAAAAPQPRRGKELRSALILRVFAIERYLRAILFAGLAIGVWRFSVSRLTVEEAYDRELPAVRTLLRQLGWNVNHSKLLGLIQHAFTLDSHTLALLAMGAAGYAALEVIEGTGLWLLKRWGEYFAMVATSVFLPYEIYDLTAKVTVLRLGAFLVNVALVLYLVLAKRLFGARGGKKAYDAALRSESILDAEIGAAAAGQPGPAGPTAEAPAGATATGAGTDENGATGASRASRAGGAGADQAGSAAAGRDAADHPEAAEGPENTASARADSPAPADGSPPTDSPAPADSSPPTDSPAPAHSSPPTDSPAPADSTAPPIPRAPADSPAPPARS